MLPLDPIKAILARLLFAVHSVVGCYAVVQAYRDTFYWLLVFTLLGLAVETTFTMLRRGGREWTWFSFASMCYLMSSLPSTWLLRIFAIGVQAQTVTTTCNPNGTVVTSIPPGALPFALDAWTRALEQSQLIILTLGRWLLPQAGLTRYQLAEQLLVYLGKAADILNLFELISGEEIVILQQDYLTYITLALWSWALLQYTYIIIRSYRLYDEHVLILCFPKPLLISLLQEISPVVMQDGPFLIFRLYLLVGLGVVSQTIIFFFCKNLVVILVELYRITSLCCEVGDYTEYKGAGGGVGPGAKRFPKKLDFDDFDGFPLDEPPPEWAFSKEKRKNKKQSKKLAKEKGLSLKSKSSNKLRPRSDELAASSADVKPLSASPSRTNSSLPERTLIKQSPEKKTLDGINRQPGDSYISLPADDNQGFPRLGDVSGPSTAGGSGIYNDSDQQFSAFPRSQQLGVPPGSQAFGNFSGQSSSQPHGLHSSPQDPQFRSSYLPGLEGDGGAYGSFQDVDPSQYYNQTESFEDQTGYFDQPQQEDYKNFWKNMFRLVGIDESRSRHSKNKRRSVKEENQKRKKYTVPQSNAQDPNADENNLGITRSWWTPGSGADPPMRVVQKTAYFTPEEYREHKRRQRDKKRYGKFQLQL